MPTIKSFRDLLVCQKSMDLAVRCYQSAQRLPKQDQMVLGYQVRKSSVSLPSNIAEGFLWTAHGSGGALETQLELGHRLELFTPHVARVLIADAQEIGRMINGLVSSLQRGRPNRH